MSSPREWQGYPEILAFVIPVLAALLKDVLT